jgi:hypothetical protein
MPRNTIISNQSAATVVTTRVNAANVRSPIFVATTPRGASYTLYNRTLVRGQVLPGLTLIVNLRDAANNPVRGTIFLGVKAEAEEFETNIRAFPLSIWNDLTTAQQRSEDYKGTLIAQTDLNTGGIELRQMSQLIVQLESAQLVDWTKSYFEYVVQERN